MCHFKERGEGRKKQVIKMKFVGDIICPIIWTVNKKGVRRMEKVDALIEALAEYIIGIISSGDVYSEAAEETKALAELISARANVL